MTTTSGRRLLISFGPNERIAPLVDGAVKPDGVDLEWDTGEIGAAFLRALTKNDFDLWEFSISHYIATRDHPNPMYAGWTIIPIFTSKPVFMYRDLFVREGAGIRSLADLRGKRLGMPDFSMTGGIWFRIVLKAMFGIEPQDIQWINTRPARLRHDNAMGFDKMSETKTGVRVVNIDEHMTPQQLMERGEVDAVVSAPEVEVHEASGIRRFSPDEWLEVLGGVRQKIGITPVNHTLVIQKALVSGRPDLPRRMFDAFVRAKEEAYRRGPKARAILPERNLDRQRELFGEDPYPYGLKANRQVLDLVAQQLVIDGVIKAKPDIDGMVAAGVRDT